MRPEDIEARKLVALTKVRHPLTESNEALLLPVATSSDDMLQMLSESPLSNQTDMKHNHPLSISPDDSSISDSFKTTTPKAWVLLMKILIIVFCIGNGCKLGSSFRGISMGDWLSGLPFSIKGPTLASSHNEDPLCRRRHLIHMMSHTGQPSQSPTGGRRRLRSNHSSKKTRLGERYLMSMQTTSESTSTSNDSEMTTFAYLGSSDPEDSVSSQPSSELGTALVTTFLQAKKEQKDEENH